jgi:hypothetical protein
MQLRSGKTYITKSVNKSQTYIDKSMYKDILVVVKHLKEKGGSTTLKHIINATREGGVLYDKLGYPYRVLGWCLKYNYIKKNKDTITLN